MRNKNLYCSFILLRQEMHAIMIVKIYLPIKKIGDCLKREVA